jgi:HTH-type transcriptional regulator / antitoxin HigA
VLPPFDRTTGPLPDGEYQVEWQELADRFCLNVRRPNMITNEVQYRATKVHLAKFEEAAANLEVEHDQTKLAQLELGGVRAQADNLRSQIVEYELLRSGAVSSFDGSSLSDLPILLVKARIARGWTQRQLADALGIAEQQVQRYESTGYRAASLARICDVASALDVTVMERAILGNPDAA